MYSIEEALKEQIKYCHELPRYHCGIYVKKFEDRKYIFDKLTKLITDNDSIEILFNSSCSAEVRFKNGSFIRIIRASENARGYRNHGAIIDAEIEDEIVNCIIMPTLIPIWFEEDRRESWEEVKKRIFYCSL